MKHSIRFIQVNYEEGLGKNILVLRGMEVREYAYKRIRMDMLLRSVISDGDWIPSHQDDYTSFAKVYPND